jgi:hypothetical protein
MALWVLLILFRLFGFGDGHGVYLDALARKSRDGEPATA